MSHRKLFCLVIIQVVPVSELYKYLNNFFKKNKAPQFRLNNPGMMRFFKNAFFQKNCMMICNYLLPVLPILGLDLENCDAD